MESDNYIDSLSVSLNLPSEYSPSKAQEEADSIVDQYVIPAVESVVEEMGQEMEARIPLVEIDVGRVRLQDLRDAIVSSLRNALDRYRSSAPREAESSVENVKEYAETGLAPWENGVVPFNPFFFLKDNLEKDFDAIRDSLVTFSEKELVSLLMATFQNTTSSSEVSLVLQLQDAIFARLSLRFPETASALTARLSAWRRYRSFPEKRISTPSGTKVTASFTNAESVGVKGNVPYDDEPLNVSVSAVQADTLSEPVIPSSAEPDSESVPSPSRPVFKYVEISMSDIPEGYSVEVSDYVERPDAHSPAYIVVLGNPNRYYRKVATDAMGNSIFSSADDAIGADAGPSSAEPDSESVPSLSHTIFKYVEINLSDIPEGGSIELGDFKENPTGTDPEFIMTFGHPAKFFKKVAVETKTVSSLRFESELAWPDTRVLISDRYENRNAQESRDVWSPRDFESEVTDARILVSDAGLVLLHPFMARMMENLGLVKKGTFVSPMARIRAVHLLRDLTGSEEPHHNHNLILEKILCGLPVGYALPLEWEPTDREKEEAEALLQAVCDYWKPLSGSSTAALCGGFILRPGTIERFEESWTIRVEGRTIDILMDDLPWELSVIFLPWLGKPIGVEWQQE